MKKVVITISLLLLWAQVSNAQVSFMGRVWGPKSPDLAEEVPPNTGISPNYFGGPDNGQPPGVATFPNVRGFASLDGPNNETIATRTWEQAPRGWYWMSGPEGKYTLMFTGPSHGLGPAVFIRPIIFTNNYVKDGVTLDRKVVPNFDFGVFHNNGWDEKPAHAYYQPFTAKGTSITNIGFKPVHDGVDGADGGSQTILVSVHEAGSGTPDTWKQIGPTGTVLEVDCGGPKDYEWTVAWDSGEIPTVPGKKYAVCLRAEKSEGKFQMYMRKEVNNDDGCYRAGGLGTTGWTKHDLWMGVSGDSDGLYVPYNKKIQKEFRDFAGSSTKWSQTYVAQGNSLAGVILYAATSGVQPSMNRQRLTVRVREDGTEGKVVGVEKLAIGHGLYTGDASWGTFGVVYSPDEVKLTPGKTYAIEFETAETPYSLDGYVNIKNMVNDKKPGFNPYKKVAPDTYAKGTSYKDGTQKMDFDLDMQIVEYANHVPDWDQALDAENLIMNGDMESGQLGSHAWSFLHIDKSNNDIIFGKGRDLADHSKNQFFTVSSREFNSKIDGGYIQKVEGLSRMDNYVLSGKMRCSFSTDWDHATCVGYDLTGQTTDPNASTIVWKAMSGAHSVWNTYTSGPIRPEKDSISIWLRGKGTSKEGITFRSDFDEFSLQRMKTEVPGM